MSSPATQQSTRLRSLETAYEQKTAARTYAQLHISKTQHADLNQNQQDGEGASQQGEHRRGDRKILGMPKVRAPATVEQETAGAAGTLELEKPNGKTSRNELRYASTSKRRVLICFDFFGCTGGFPSRDLASARSMPESAKQSRMGY
jgi:hypothetical protein